MDNSTKSLTQLLDKIIIDVDQYIVNSIKHMKSIHYAMRYKPLTPISTEIHGIIVALILEHESWFEQVRGNLHMINKTAALLEKVSMLQKCSGYTVHLEMISEKYSQELINTVKLAKDRGEDVNPIYSGEIKDMNGFSPLHIAAYGCFHDVLGELLHYLEPQNIKRGSGLKIDSELMIAIEHKNTALIDWLLENDTDITYRNESGQSALHSACIIKDDKIIERLISKVAREKGHNAAREFVNAADDEGTTCLIYLLDVYTPETVIWPSYFNIDTNYDFNIIRRHHVDFMTWPGKIKGLRLLIDNGINSDQLALATKAGLLKFDAAAPLDPINPTLKWDLLFGTEKPLNYLKLAIKIWENLPQLTMGSNGLHIVKFFVDNLDTMISLESSDIFQKRIVLKKIKVALALTSAVDVVESQIIKEAGIIAAAMKELNITDGKIKELNITVDDLVKEYQEKFLLPQIIYGLIYRHITNLIKVPGKNLEIFGELLSKKYMPAIIFLSDALKKLTLGTGEAIAPIEVDSTAEEQIDVDTVSFPEVFDIKEFYYSEIKRAAANIINHIKQSHDAGAIEAIDNTAEEEMDVDAISSPSILEVSESHRDEAYMAAANILSKILGQSHDTGASES